MSTKRSPIWDYFKVGEDTKFAICNACGQSISRGGKTTKTFNTTNLVYHKGNTCRAAFRVTEEVRRKNEGKGKRSK